MNLSLDGVVQGPQPPIVASTTLESADAWQNSVAYLETATRSRSSRQDGKDLSVVGSAQLVRSLHAAGLIDQETS